MKLETIQIAQGKEVAFDNIFYFKGANKMQNKVMKAMAVNADKIRIPEELQKFTYSVDTIEASGATKGRILVRLADRFSDGNPIKATPTFLTGKFEGHETGDILKEYRDFLLTAAYSNFERLTGIPYEKYKRQKAIENRATRREQMDTMMSFMVVDTSRLYDTQYTLSKNTKAMLKPVKDKTKEEILKEIDDLKFEVEQMDKCEKICDLKIEKKKGERHRIYIQLPDDEVTHCDLADYNPYATVLYIFFLRRAKTIKESKIDKRNNSVTIEELGTTYREEICEIGKEYTGHDFEPEMGKLCKKAAAYIDVVNDALAKIFKIGTAQKYFIWDFRRDELKDGEIPFDKPHYGIRLNADRIDLGDFK